MIGVKTYEDCTDITLSGTLSEIFTDTWRTIHGIYVTLNEVDPEGAETYKDTMLKSFADERILSHTFSLEFEEGGDADA